MNIRVVLVDDHMVVRAGLRALVDGFPGMTVVGEGSDGNEAIALARDLAPDVIVMDLSMPEMDGATATDRIRKECPKVRVIVLTAHDDRAHLTRLLQAGADGYVLKRAAADELITAIRIVADGGSYVDPVLAGRVLKGAIGPVKAPSLESLDPLSDREEEVLRQIAWGHSNKEVALALGISTKTVETYRTRISQKLGLKGRTEMVRYALHRGWLTES